MLSDNAFLKVVSVLGKILHLVLFDNAVECRNTFVLGIVCDFIGVGIHKAVMHKYLVILNIKLRIRQKYICWCI